MTCGAKFFTEELTVHLENKYVMHHTHLSTLKGGNFFHFCNLISTLPVMYIRNAHFQALATPPL